MLWKELFYILIVTKDDSSTAFFTGKLNYSLLIRTFCSRQSNHLINKLQERALRIINKAYDSSFSGLLEMLNKSFYD